jgi:hypothetical protein
MYFRRQYLNLRYIAYCFALPASRKPSVFVRFPFFAFAKKRKFSKPYRDDVTFRLRLIFLARQHDPVHLTIVTETIGVLLPSYCLPLFSFFSTCVTSADDVLSEVTWSVLLVLIVATVHVDFRIFR